MALGSIRRVRAAVLPLALVSAALGGIPAAHASLPPHLAPHCDTAGTTVTAYGATFQTNAQQNVFIPAYNAACGAGAASISYNSPLGPGAGSGTCVDLVTKHTPRAGYGYSPYCGSDDALTTQRWLEANLGLNPASSPTNAGGVIQQIPVAIGAVAIPFNSSGTGCPATLALSSSALSNIFDGTWTTWNQVPSCTGTASITRVVRLNTSGTTWIFRDYLGKRNPSFALHNAQNGKDNDTWPTGSSTLVRSNGNSGVASSVNTTAGAIGYVEWSEARKTAYSFSIAQVKRIDQEVAGGGADPNVPAGAAGRADDPVNCSDEGVTLPLSTLLPGWDTVSISDGATAYPICGYTYIFLFTNQLTGPAIGVGPYGSNVSSAQQRAGIDLAIVAVSDSTQASLTASGYAPVGQRARLSARLGLAVTLHS